MPQMYHLYVRREKEDVWERFKKMCKEEGVAISEKILELIEMYVRNHEGPILDGQSDVKDVKIEEVEASSEEKVTCDKCRYCEQRYYYGPFGEGFRPWCTKFKMFPSPNQASRCMFFEPKGEE